MVEYAGMALLVGIDEAGYGPLLGPLVVSSATFEVPDGLEDADLWHLLARSVARTRKALAGRLLIADSKKAFIRSQGIRQLERTVLSALRCIGHEPKTLAELLAALSAECLERIAEYPWHKDIRTTALCRSDADVRIASAVFADDMSKAGAKLADLHSCCFDVAYYNRLVADLRNKAGVLFVATTQLIQRALDISDARLVRVIVDRHGGRIRYREGLQRCFDAMTMRILEESDRQSSYELRSGQRVVRISFLVEGDDQCLAASLASMVSKYLRELMMDGINRYFLRLHSALKPTAGYWTDGQRFVKDLRTALPQINIDNDMLIRCR